LRYSEKHRYCRRAGADLDYLWASVRGVNPTVEAAWIAAAVGAFGIAGTVVTAIFSSRNTRRATEATVAAARDQRLWEKRAAAYEETVAGLVHRQLVREQDLRGFRLDEAAEQRLKEFISSYDERRWIEAEGRMVAYASNAVLTAFMDAIEAHGKVLAAYERYARMADDNKQAVRSGRSGTAHSAEDTRRARRDVEQPLKEAGDKDQALIELIRAELRSKPEGATLPATVPAERRRSGTGVDHGR
jgi:hypothetical protein